MKARGRMCELCGRAAVLHCGADAAYLCWGCDARVHGANFLVARHVRCVMCCACGGPAGRRLSGPGSGPGSAPIRSLCPSCRPDAGDPATSSATSSSSSCVSSAESSAATERKSSLSAASSRRRVSVEAVLERWSHRMGFRSGSRCVRTACHVLAACGREMAVFPLRVALAAALWHAINSCGEVAAERNGTRRRGLRTCETTLRTLEACSRVPARLIVAAESRIARAARRTRTGLDEGWAESS